MLRKDLRGISGLYFGGYTSGAMQPGPERFLPFLEQGLPAQLLPFAPSLAGYLQLVADYSPALNLTALKEPRELAAELVLEALRLLELGGTDAIREACDLGSGNGSPVVPLAVCLPGLQFTAVESRLRRSTFLRQVQARLHLSNLELFEGRAEEFALLRPQSFDLVTSRAFAAPDVFLGFAVALQRPCGEIRGFYGEAIGDVLDAAAALGLPAPEVISYPHGESVRHVYRIALPA